MNESLKTSFVVFVFFCTVESRVSKINLKDINEELRVVEDDGEEKSSLVFVMDTTGSMYDDLKQLREGAEMILNTALEESDVIDNFVFVPYHDPDIGPATVTRDKKVFKSALNAVRVHGGGDCPEKSLGGIQLALNVSRPRSYIYVLTDATASDYKLVAKVLDSVQRKQSQVVFVLTGHCNDLDKPSFKVYQQIAAASSGQIFNLNKTSVHKVLDFVRASIKGRTVNLGSAIKTAGSEFTQEIPVDSTLGEVTVSVSGANPKIQVINPSGELVTGPPQLVTTLDLAEIMIVKVQQPEPGNWSITVGSEDDYSVKVVGLSNLTFDLGFSVERPYSMHETSYRPLKGTYNYMMVALTQTDQPVYIDYAQILNLEGKPLFELRLREVDATNKVYLADAFIPPDDFFYVAINGKDENNLELRRIGATAIQAKSPDIPYLRAPKRVEGRAHTRIVLKCYVESLVPVTAAWTKDNYRIQEQISSLQSTSVEYVIEDMSASHAGKYRCYANNVAGRSHAFTQLDLIVDAPIVTIDPNSNSTAYVGEDVILSCLAFSEEPLIEFAIVHNATGIRYDGDLKTNADGLYTLNKTVEDVSEAESGFYTCVAANTGGQSKQSTHVTVQPKPTAFILNSKNQSVLMGSDIQLTCVVENAKTAKWIAPNGSVVNENKSTGRYSHVLNITDVGLEYDGAWTCMANRDPYEVSESMYLSVLIRPKASIKESESLTVLLGTPRSLTCEVTARPAPKITWRQGVKIFSTEIIKTETENVYRSILSLNTTDSSVRGVYECIAENPEGVDRDTVAVEYRKKMEVIEGFSDKSLELYSQVDLHCEIDSHPTAAIKWYHNDTELVPHDNVRLSEDGTVLYVLKADFDDFGKYSCEADDGFDKIWVNGTIYLVGLESPVLDKEPSRVTVNKRNSTKITCRILKGNPEPTISWQYKNITAEQFEDLPHTIAVSSNRFELTLSNVDIDDAGVYRCVGINAAGSDFYDVSLVVHYPPQLAPSTETEDIPDKPIEVKAGERVVFSCKAVGLPPPIVIWSKDNQPVSYTNNIYLTDDYDLVINNATMYDSGLFTCDVTNTMGSLQKNFTLFVYIPPIIIPPQFDPQVEILEGQLVDLPCKASGVPRPEVEWLQNGRPIGDARKYIDEYGLRFVANLTDFGDYTCFVKNAYGNATFNFTIHIWVVPSIEPSFERELQILLGSNLTLECNVVGFPVPTVSWEYQDVLLTENTTDVSFNDIGNIYISNVNSEHEGRYACIAENLAGVAVMSTYLSVYEQPKILEDTYKDPYIATNMDTLLSLPCKVIGKPQPYVMWTKDDTYLDNDSRYDIDSEGTLTINSPSEDLSGPYTCIARNAVGTVNKTINVQIYSIPAKIQGDESQSSVTVLEGSDVTVDCPIQSSATDIVKWYKDARLITQGPFQIHKVTRNDSSVYACVVNNFAGSAYSLVRINVEWGPQFVDNITSVVGAVRGDDKYLDCDVDSKPAAKIKWLFKSKPILGEEKTRLKLLNIQLIHSGSYKCIVSNYHGTISREFFLDVMEAPFISEFDFLDVQLKEGTNATLECNPKGSPTPEVVWIYNNTKCHVQNKSLTCTNVTTKDEGVYQCEARNKAGRTHLTYRVGVALAATIQEIIEFKGGEGVIVDRTVRIAQGSHVRLACKAIGQPEPRIQWIRNGNTLSENAPNISYADLVLDGVETTQAGEYFCIATNEGGVDHKRVKVDVLEPPKIFETLFQNSNSSDNTVNMEVISGQAFYLHCHPYGNPVPQIYWFKDGVPLKLFDDKMVSTEYGEVIVSRNALYEQSGNYTCIARNEVGNSSFVYILDVLVPPPKPKEISKSVSTRIGSPLNLTCLVEGSPPPNVMWIKDPYTEISEQKGKIMLLNNNYTLIIKNTQVSDSGKYSCIMTNKVGTTELVYDVTIEKPAAIVGNVKGNEVESHAVSIHRSVVLKCEVDGYPPPKISWLKDTQELRSNMKVHLVLGNSLLTIWSVQPRDAGQYICVVENVAGSQHRRYNLAVQVPGKWSSWSNWSLCDVTCGEGHQLRSRVCQYIDDYIAIDNFNKSDKIILDESACKGPKTDRRKCHLPSCEEDETQPRWGSWTKWSVCSSSCGSGTQTRTRRCKTKIACQGDNVQIRKCPGLPKCNFTQSETVNEVYSSGEDTTEEQPYIPEATFEINPEEIGVPTVDVEDTYIRPEKLPVYYEVNVTVNLDGSEIDLCDPGYRHNASTQNCDDIDECLIMNNECHSTQVCANTPGAYRCSCQRGYSSLGAGQRCLDINECQLGSAGCEFACVNVAGGYVCACPRHLRLHVDRHHCVKASQYQKPFNEEATEEYLSFNIDSPAKYTKTAP